LSTTSYSNVGDNRNGVRGTTSARRNHPSQSPGSSATNGNGLDGDGNSAGVNPTCQRLVIMAGDHPGQ
jgi:hypothetical protein